MVVISSIRGCTGRALQAGGGGRGGAACAMISLALASDEHEGDEGRLHNGHNLHVELADHVQGKERAAAQ